MSNIGIRLAVAALVAMIWTKSVFAEFCKDLHSALALSTSFAKLRGSENGYNAWKSNVVITGAQSCNILTGNAKYTASSYSLYCSMGKLSSEMEGAREFATLVARIKTCAPRPRFSYHVKKRNSTISFILDKDHRILGHLTVIRIPDVIPADKPVYDAKSGTTRKPVQLNRDSYWLELVIIGQ